MPTEQTDKSKQGAAFAQWFATATFDRVTNAPTRNADIARIVKMSPTRVGVLLNDCYDRAEERYKMPSAELIDRIAAAFNADADEGRRIVGYTPCYIEMTSEPDPDAAYMMASYNGLDAPDKEIARRMIDALRKTERAKGIAGGLIRPRRPA